MNKNVSIRLIKKVNLKNQIRAALLLKDGRLAVSYDTSIYIYNTENYECDIIIKGHKSVGIELVQLDNEKLITAAEEVKIYKLFKTSYICEFSFLPEGGRIFQLVALANNRMVSCHDKPYLIFWSSKPPYKKLKKVKTGIREFDILYGVKKRKNLLFCCEMNNDFVYVWNSKTYHCITCITCTEIGSYNGFLEIANNKLIISNSSSIASVINLETLAVEKKYEWKKDDDDLENFDCFYEIKKNLILCGGGSWFLLDLKRDRVKVIEKCTDVISNLIPLGNNILMAYSIYSEYFQIWKLTT